MVDPLGLFGLGSCTNCHQGGGDSLNDLLNRMTPSDPLFPPGGQASSSDSSSSSSGSSAEGEKNCPDKLKKCQLQIQRPGGYGKGRFPWIPEGKVQCTMSVKLTLVSPKSLEY
jgi:hypothetical protein